MPSLRQDKPRRRNFSKPKDPITVLYSETAILAATQGAVLNWASAENRLDTQYYTILVLYQDNMNLSLSLSDIRKALVRAGSPYARPTGSGTPGTYMP